MPKRGLGQGLGALIPAEETSSDGLQEVPLDAIVPNPHQPRMPFRDQDIVELASSIQEHGVIQPLVVTHDPAGKYQLIAGERRWRASKLAGLLKVPVIIKDVAPQQMLELALVENIQRSDLNPLEEALAYKQLVDEFKLSQSDVARRVGKSRVAITNTMRLLQASEAIQAALMDGKISEGHARALIGLTTAAEQDEALQYVIAENLNVRQTETLVQRLHAGETLPKPHPPVSPEVRTLEEHFQESLGTRVRLKTGRKGGRVIIYYYSDEEFRGLYQRLTGTEL
ncbi:MAG: ParB/RepB/Spo0J family partition protein [Anaerolineae bacterium]|nr:ParB/RepB/Spo0J family partition protein [Anaerolineae bacterium]